MMQKTSQTNKKVAFQLADPYQYFEIPPESVKSYKVMMKVFKF